MLTTLPPSCAVVMKSGNLNFLENSGPFQACNGTALPLPLPLRVWNTDPDAGYPHLEGWWLSAVWLRERL